MSRMKKVAIFAANIYGAMYKETLRGINSRAVECGIKAISFASFSDFFSAQFYDQYIKYDEGDIVTFKLPDLNVFDGVIVLDSSFPGEYKERIYKIIDEARIPVVVVGGKHDTYYNILNAENESFGSVIEHVIEKHGCRDICHIAGKPGKDFTYERIEAYKSVLRKYDLEVSDEKIYFGSLWRDCGAPALEYFLDLYKKKGGKPYPDAIICANDYTAIGLADACRAKGIRVPEDIIITGYDGIDVANYGYPSITTSSQPFAGVGKAAVDKLVEIWDKGNAVRVSRVNGELFCNQSCGCKPRDQIRTEEIRQIYNNRMGKMEYLAQSNTNMILGISNSKSLEDCFKEIEKDAKIDTGFKNFVLCLAPDWDKLRVVDDATRLGDEEMTAVAGFVGDKPIPRCTFHKKDLLPDFLMDDPNPYFIFSVHHLQYYMGYIIVTPELENYNQLIVKSWLVNLGSMLENWRIRRELKVAVERLENLYNRDMLTGLYNRRGYEYFFEEFYKACIKEGNDANIAVMLIDMDDLKYVNDNLGHIEGDYSLCTIAESMTVAAQNGEICLRTGGDEFVVLARNYDMKKADAYIKKLREHIKLRMSRDKKGRKLEVSVGIYIATPEPTVNEKITKISENYMKLADVEMYKEKKEHKRYSRG